MRLWRRKSWRAFPELDTFSDEQCAIWVREIRRREVLSALQMLYFAFAAMVMTAAAVVSAGIHGARWLMHLSGIAIHRYETAAILMVLGLVAGLLVGKYIHDRWLRKHLRQRLRGLLCVGCRYPLAGVQPNGIVLTCPECGQRQRPL